MSDRWDYWRKPYPTGYEYCDMTHEAACELLAERDALKAALRELVEAEIGLNLGPQDNRPIDDAESRYVNAWAAVRILAAP